MKLILLGSEATVVVTDMLQFNQLAERLDPVELGVVLSSYYEHIAAAIDRCDGRLVKFVGDGVLAAFEGARHRDRALDVVESLGAQRAAWLADNAKVHLPAMDYAIGVATGEVLSGEFGTDRIHFWDVIGAPVNLAFRLCALATDRKVAHLVDAAALDGIDGDRRARFVEVDAAELAGQRHRLYRLPA